MFVREEIVEHKSKENGRHGKEIIRTRRKTIYHLSCDKCGGPFSREKGEMDAKRLNNGCKHYCSECFSYGFAAKSGQESRTKYLESKIGEKVIDSCGYVRVYVGPESSDKRIYQFHNDYCGAVREHILVMEQHLGRPMQKGEVVHHIDGDKTNNNIRNLQVMTVAQHNACHGKIESVVFELYKRGVVGYDRKTRTYFVKEKNE